MVISVVFNTLGWIHPFLALGYGTSLDSFFLRLPCVLVMFAENGLMKMDGNQTITFVVLIDHGAL